MIAQVIVDVAAMQTDRLFEYLVPQELEDTIEVGARIVVPFGKSRKVQGFVINLVESTDYTGELKELLLVIDEVPPLTPELIDLSAWLSNHIFTYRISILKTMLPSVMRANYRKILVPLVVNDTTVTELFGKQTEIDVNEIEDPYITRKINRLLREQKVKIEYLVESKAKVKEEFEVDILLSSSELEDERRKTRANATQQLHLLDVMANARIFPISEQILKEDYGLTSATLKTAAEKGWISRTKTEVYRNPLNQNTSGDVIETQNKRHEVELFSEQQDALQQINQSVAAKSATTFLLEGVTGSGKTEVYLRAIKDTLAKKQTALMLVPEISLTPQMVRQVQERFSGQVAVLHSGLSEGEKYDEWRRIRRGEASVVVGARSAIFAPLKNLGLIIIDEEHETSYKQNDNPRYHARDVALFRSKKNHATLVLGSATPSLESRARATKNVYHLLRMNNRTNQRALPDVQLIDLKDAQFVGEQFDLTKKLVDALKERKRLGQQSILMLNRRGFSSFLLCRSCGFVLKCPNCDISLTYHKTTNQMKCHYCGHAEAVPDSCPNCHEKEIRFYGTGTQKVEEELRELLPDATVLRMDVDTTRRKGSYEKILSSFGRGEADILLGTQMIAKGLDFKNVTLVGVINADTALAFPDFRAEERTFQLLTQVSGRAGRGQLSGQVLVQTFNPDNYAIALSKTQDYEQFYQHEMKVRHEGNYPPYFYTVLISVSSKKEQNASKQAFIIKRKLLNELNKTAIILGPTPSAISKIKQQYFYQILVKYKYEDINPILNKLKEEAQAQKKYGVTVYIDLEPDKFM